MRATSILQSSDAAALLARQVLRVSATTSTLLPIPASIHIEDSDDDENDDDEKMFQYTVSLHDQLEEEEQPPRHGKRRSEGRASTRRRGSSPPLESHRPPRRLSMGSVISMAASTRSEASPLESRMPPSRRGDGEQQPMYIVADFSMESQRAPRRLSMGSVMSMESTRSDDSPLESRLPPARRGDDDPPRATRRSSLSFPLESQRPPRRLSMGSVVSMESMRSNCSPLPSRMPPPRRQTSDEKLQPQKQMSDAALHVFEDDHDAQVRHHYTSSSIDEYRHDAIIPQQQNSVGSLGGDQYDGDYDEEEAKVRSNSLPCGDTMELDCSQQPPSHRGSALEYDVTKKMGHLEQDLSDNSSLSDSEDEWVLPVAAAKPALPVRRLSSIRRKKPLSQICEADLEKGVPKRKRSGASNAPSSSSSSLGITIVPLKGEDDDTPTARKIVPLRRHISIQRVRNLQDGDGANTDVSEDEIDPESLRKLPIAGEARRRGAPKSDDGVPEESFTALSYQHDQWSDTSDEDDIEDEKEPPPKNALKKFVWAARAAAAMAAVGGAAYVATKVLTEDEGENLDEGGGVNEVAGNLQPDVTMTQDVTQLANAAPPPPSGTTAMTTAAPPPGVTGPAPPAQ